MSSELDPTAELAFLDGYLLRVIVEMLASSGLEESGLYAYYERRVEITRSALSAYDKVLLDYVVKNFDKAAWRIVHAGIGIGTLTSALVVAGYAVAGVERDAGRFQAASQVRKALAQIWPSQVEGYSLIQGEFPTIIEGARWKSRDVLLIFTNCVAGWSEPLTESIIASFPAYGSVILDTQLFGRIRDMPEERQALVQDIEGHGLTIEPIAGMPSYAYYYHISRERGAL